VSRGLYNGTGWDWEIQDDMYNTRMDNIANAVDGTLWSVDGYSGVAGPAAYVEYLVAEPCAPCCELTVTHKRIRAEKLTKPRKVVLTVTGADETFDIFGLIDLGPLSWHKVKFNHRKNQLKIHAIVPAGLEPGMVMIRVGECFGWVEIE